MYASVVFTYAKDSILRDESNKEYIDFFSEAGTLNYGHNNDALKEKLIEYLQRDGVVHGLSMATTAKKSFLDAVDRYLLMPRQWDYELRFTGPTGSSAIEAALTLARQVTGRQHIISFAPNFQGMPYDGYLGPDVDTMTYFERVVEDLGNSPNKPAAVIVETVQGKGGVNVATYRWLKALQQLCADQAIVFIIDDTQVGCGRTAKFFSFEAAGLEPDIITLSKSLSGYGLPMSLMLVKPELHSSQLGTHSPFHGNSLALVTATHALSHYWASTTFSDQVQEKEVLVRDWLENLVHSYPGSGLSVRGRGLIQGLVTSAGSDMALEIAKRCFENGLILETSGVHNEVVKLLPALTIEKALLKKGLHILEQSVAAVMAQTPRTTKMIKLGALSL